MMSLPVWLPGPIFLLEGLCLWSHVPSRGSLSLTPFFLLGGLSDRDIPDKRPPWTDIPPGQRSPWIDTARTETPPTVKSGRYDPTRMHSCFEIDSLVDPRFGQGGPRTGLPWPDR